jgi:hypothetical protein
MSAPVPGTWRIRSKLNPRTYAGWAKAVLSSLAHKTADWKVRLSSWKDAAATLQAGATILALAVGGYWFYTQRADKPRLKIEH